MAVPASWFSSLQGCSALVRPPDYFAYVSVFPLLHSVHVLYFTNCAVSGGFSYVGRLVSSLVSVVSTGCMPELGWFGFDCAVL